MPAVIDIEHLRKAYAGVQALDDASLVVHAGEVHGLVGANGAGKSTLIKVLAGAVSRDSGSIKVDGIDAPLAHERAAYDLGLRFIHQDLGIAARLSVAENVFLGRKMPSRAGLVSVHQTRSGAREILKDFIDVDPARKMSTLSVAQQWMVAVARACTVDARVVVMDEPTAALSEAEVHLVFDAVDRLIKRDLAVVFVSHRLPEILRLADRVTVMKDGRTIGTHEVGGLDKDTLVSLIIGEEGGSPAVKARRAPTAEQSWALEVKGLTGGPIKDVSLGVREGEILGLSGLVGSGRTSLLQQIFGVHPMDAGEVRIAGKATSIRSPADAVKLGVAMIPEERRAQGLMVLRTVRDNTVLTHLPLFRWHRRVPVPLRRREVAATNQQIEAMSVRTTGSEQRISYLSGGNQQKVLVGRWLVGNGPRVIMLDEPTKGVDVRGKGELYQIIRDLAASGVAILLVSSDLEEVAAICHRSVVLAEGRVVGELLAPMTEADILGLCFQGRAA